MKNKFFLISAFVLFNISFSANTVVAQQSFENYPEWYFNPPQDYEKSQTFHFIATSTGASYDEALAGAIWGMASKIHAKLHMLDKMNAEYGEPTNYAVKGSIRLDSLVITGADLTINDDYAFSEDQEFQISYRVFYESGRDTYLAEGSYKENSSSWSEFFAKQTEHDGYEKFRNYIETTPKWAVVEKEIVNDEFFLLLEYRSKQEKLLINN